MNISLQSVTALVRDEQSGHWLQFSDAIEIVSTVRLAEVEAKFQRLQTLVDQGLYAVGYVAYEAAPAFDSSLSVQPTSAPLLCFAVFGKPVICQLPPPLPTLPLSLATTLEHREYLEKVARIKDHLEVGDFYQVNFTHTLKGVHSEYG